MGYSVYPAPSAGSIRQYVQEFTSTGTFTVPSNVSAVEVFLVGGGGGAGGTTGSTNTSFNYCGSGGGGGGVVRRTISVTPGASYTVTIGGGGSGSANGTSNGSVGSNSTFGALLTANGGGGGQGCPQTGMVALNSLGANSGGTAPGGGSGNKFGGSGGGAGGNATFVNVNISGGSSLSTLAVQGVSANKLDASNGFSGTYGIYNTFADTINQFPGPGIDRYGYGGPGGICVSGTTNPYYIASQGGVAPVRSVVNGDNFNGNSGAANTGNGGGGAAHRSSGTQVSASGGNGGSGYARITYWA